MLFRSVAQSCPTISTLWTVTHQTTLSTGFSRQEYWRGCHFLLQEIFPTQGLKPGLLHCRQMLYHLSHQGSPLSQKGSLNLDLHVDLREGGRKLRLGPDPSPTWGHTWSFPRAPYCPCIWRILDYLLSAPKGKVQSSSRLESTFLLDFSLPALELKQKQKRLLLKAGRLRP